MIGSLCFTALTLPVTYAATFAYVANESSHTVSVINTATNVVVDTIAVGTAPVGVAITQKQKDIHG